MAAYMLNLPIADEVVQAYIQYPQLSRMPLKEWKGLKRISVNKGSSGTAEISIPVTDLQKWDTMNTPGTCTKANTNY